MKKVIEKKTGEKYGYLGSVPDDKYYNKAMVPLVFRIVG